MGEMREGPASRHLPATGKQVEHVVFLVTILDDTVQIYIKHLSSLNDKLYKMNLADWSKLVK